MTNHSKAEPIFVEELAARVTKDVIEEHLKNRKKYDPKNADRLKAFRFKKGQPSPNPGGKPKDGIAGKDRRQRWNRISRAVKSELLHASVAKAIAKGLIDVAQDTDHPSWLGAVDRVLERTEGKVVAKAEIKGTVQVARMAVVGLTPEEAARVALDFGTPEMLTNGHDSGS